MGDFGHIGTIGDGFCIDIWGAGPFSMRVGEKTWLFEDSDQFGPLFLNKNGSPRTSQNLSERSPFWRAHRIWVRQGRRLDPNGFCVWDEPAPMTYWRVGRFAKVVESGEEDGAEIEVPRPLPQPSDKGEG